MLRVWLLAFGAGVLMLGAWQGATYKHYPAELPAAIKDDLRSRGCDVLREHGVVKSPEYTAVLCRIRDEASLLIYTGGKPVEVNKHPGGLDERDPEAARGIRIANWDYVARHNPGLNLAEHPRTCIEDGIGMGSVLYCHLGNEWAGLAGAD